MPVTTKAVALLTVITPADIAALPPAQRTRLAQICRAVADMAEPATRQVPRSGVLGALKRGVRAE